VVRGGMQVDSDVEASSELWNSRPACNAMDSTAFWIHGRHSEREHSGPCLSWRIQTLSLPRLPGRMLTPPQVVEAEIPFTNAMPPTMPT
jgi:hypothetical protein